MQEKSETDLDAIQREVQDLLNRPSPYCFLNTEEMIQQKLTLLDGLHVVDMGNLAARVAFDCPAITLTAYIQIISKFLKKPNVDYDSEEATSSSTDTELGFCEMLCNALETKRIILKLLDSNNPKPYREFLDTHYNSSLFTAFRELSLKMLKGHELWVAEKLASSTPDRECRLVCANLNKSFHGTEFAKCVTLSFKVRADINYYLLKKDPTQFFLNSDFLPENYLKFPLLIECLLKDKETGIAKKLAKVSQPDRFLVIGMGLEKLASIASFKLIANCIDEEKQKIQLTNATLTCSAEHLGNPNRLFTKENIRKRSNLFMQENNADSEFISAEDGLMNLELLEEEEPNICKKYCTLF